MLNEIAKARARQYALWFGSFPSASFAFPESKFSPQLKFRRKVAEPSRRSQAQRST